MSETGMTAIALKQINKNKVYQFIYKEGVTSKQQIVRDLQMGLSTVSQNLKILEDEGLIEKNGYFDSTGGRKAQAIRIRSTARVAIGAGILKEMVHIAAVDLHGKAVCTAAIHLPYEASEPYYRRLGQEIDRFVDQNGIGRPSVLGVSIATQGILSPDGQTVGYGAIMNNTGMRLSDLSRFISYPCCLEHDSKAAAYLELWNRTEIDSAVVFLLNRNLGGAIVTGRRVHHGTKMHSGAIEHMCVDPNGPLCYCGNRGCLETYCSANALESASGVGAPEFFTNLRQDASQTSSQFRRIWNRYLDHLAFAMRNLYMVIDSPAIISGYLAPYFTEEDLSGLLDRINSTSPFPISGEQVIVGTQGQYTPAIGAALTYIDQFLQTI